MNFLRSVLFEEEEPRPERPTPEDKDKAEDEERQPLKEPPKEPAEELVKEGEAATKESKEESEEKAEKKEKNDKKEMTPEIETLEPEEPPETSESSAPTGLGGFGALGGWGFGTIVKTLKAKSEELFNEYKEELQEFSQGIKRETEELVEITGHKVKDLPSSLESGAQVAQESLEDVGQTIEEFGTSLWRGTREIFAQVREAVALVEEEAALNGKAKTSAPGYAVGIQRGKYSRYEALVSAMQRDSSTYCDEPEDSEEYAVWKSSFKMEDKKPDIDNILKDNAFMQELQSRIVPVIVEHETFWTRYFYRLHKLQQAEDARADLVKRAANTEEEELSWDVDEDGESPGSKAATPTATPKGQATHEGKEAQEPAAEKGEGLAGQADSAPEKRSQEKSTETSGVDTEAGLSNEDKPAAGEFKPEPQAAQPSANPTPGQAAPAEAPEEEGGSDGSSTGSEWQVVSQESPKAAQEAPKPPSTSEAGLSGAKSSGQDEEEEVELETIDDLPVGEEEEEASRQASPPAGSSREGRKAQKAGEGEEEDWGEWE